MISLNACDKPKFKLYDFIFRMEKMNVGHLYLHSNKCTEMTEFYKQKYPFQKNKIKVYMLQVLFQEVQNFEAFQFKMGTFGNCHHVHDAT